MIVVGVFFIGRYLQEKPSEVRWQVTLIAPATPK
jgi:hypothetical protein